MKKLNIFLVSALFVLSGCSTTVQPVTPSNNNDQQDVVKHQYEISETNLSIKVEQSTKLYISDNGTLLNNIT